jgi:hypothetical protein
MNTLDKNLTQHAIKKHNERILRTIAANALLAVRNPNNTNDLKLIQRHANDLIITIEGTQLEDLQ